MSWFFQEKKQNQQPQTAKLPTNFAEQILDIELELDSPNLTLQQVTQLLELYTLAIEYYSSTKSEKYLVFMQKQQNLLKRDKVQDLINGNQSEVKKENQQKKDLESNIKNIQQMDKNYQVQQLINGAKDNQKKIQNIIDDDFKNQDQRVQQRIMQRIKVYYQKISNFKDPVKFKNAISKSTSLRNLDIVKTEEPQIQQPIIQLEKVKEKEELKEKNNIREFNIKDLPKPSEFKQQIKTANNLDDTFESPDQVSNPINIADLQNPKSRKVRDIVNRNHTLKIQKKELNNVLPF